MLSFLKVTIKSTCVCSIGQLGLTDPSYYYYLNQSGTYSVDGTDDVKEYEETRVSDCCMFVVSVQSFPSGQICSCTCKTIYVAFFLLRTVEVKNMFKVIQHHPTTAGSKKHTEGWDVEPCLLGPLKVLMVSLHHLTFCMGKFSQKELWTCFSSKL